LKLLGLIGSNIAHSQSPALFKDFFNRESKTDWDYKLFDLNHIDELTKLLELPHLIGLNVTIPFKQWVIPFLNELEPSAAETGAVNTIKIKKSAGSAYLTGYNTDVIGFEKSLNATFGMLHTRALILGNGGAAQSVKQVFKKYNIPFKFF
jgi:shikimate dehydrogenase